MQSAVHVLVRGEGVDDVGLRAGAERADLRAGVILVIEALVRGFGVEIDGAGAGRAWGQALVCEGQRAAGEVANDGGVAVHREVAAERQRKGADGP